MRMTLTAAALTVAGAFAASTASAATFIYENTGGTFGNGGSFSNVTSTYDAASEQLTWLVDNGQRGGDIMDGAWLVLSDGPNPKRADVNELAIFYLDFTTNRMAAYAYNGLNNSNSWLTPGVFLGDYSSGVVNSGTTRGFSIDASAINAATVPNSGSGWQGTGFGSQIGIWFHPVFGLNAGYNADGSLNQWDFAAQTWLDLNAVNTVSVDEPALLGLMGLGLLVMSGFARRRSV
ncbi:MAG: hypothetical protein AAFX85_11700 [Pseudomonadota bacterium]